MTRDFSQRANRLVNSRPSALYKRIKMNIRSEKPDDRNEIRRINIEAFDTHAEAELIDKLRESGIALISLVAEENGELVGHILFSPIKLEERESNISIAGLANRGAAGLAKQRYWLKVSGGRIKRM
jgi:predicted N-acetyltransferase YhbS